MSKLSIKIGAVLDGSFNTVIKGSSSQLTHLGENIRKLDSSLKSVSEKKYSSTHCLQVGKCRHGKNIKIRLILSSCKATIGVVSNPDHPLF